MKLKAIIFDVDGTLADTERDCHRVAFNRAFHEAGLKWHWGQHEYAELTRICGGRERLTHYIERQHATLAKRPEFHDRVAQLHWRKTEIYGELIRGGSIGLRPGVHRLISEAIEKGIHLAIATTAQAENVHALLETQLGKHSAKWFDVVAAGDCVSEKKPAPDIYRYVLNKLAKYGVAAENCIAIEDSENGLRSALGAGLKVLVTPTEYTQHHDFTGAEAVVEDLGECELSSLQNVIEHKSLTSPAHLKNNNKIITTDTLDKLLA